MVDIVTNHMAYDGCGTCVDYSQYNPFNKQSYYHPFCLIDYNNQTSVEQVCCLLSTLDEFNADEPVSAGLATTPYLCQI
jgi:hypothetical protein